MSIANPQVRTTRGSHLDDLRAQRASVQDRMRHLGNEITDLQAKGELARAESLKAEMRDLKRVSDNLKRDIKNAESGPAFPSRTQAELVTR